MRYQGVAVALVVISACFVVQSRVIQRRTETEDDLNEDLNSNIGHQDHDTPLEEVAHPVTTRKTLPPDNGAVSVTTTLSSQLASLADLCKKTLALANAGIQLDAGLQKAMSLVNCPTNNNEALQAAVNPSSNMNNMPNINTILGTLSDTNVILNNIFSQSTQRTTLRPEPQKPVAAHNVAEESLK